MNTNLALGICSRAMALIGADNVNSFDDGTNEAQISSALYESTLVSALTEHRWNFATVQAQAVKLAQAPEDRFAIQYELPNPILTIDLVSPDRYPYELFSDRRIMTDYDGDLWVEGVFRVDESKLPGYFIEYLEYRLATKFAFPITADKGLAGSMQDLADRHQKRAKSADSKQRKGIGFKKFPLIQARG